jgi:hypothetical protein
LLDTPLLTYLLTYSMVQSPSWEAKWFAASQEIPRISRNPKVQYRTQKRPPTVHILGQPNPVHIPTSHLLKIHPNIIHPSTPRSLQWSPSRRFPQQDPIHPLSSPIRLRARARARVCVCRGVIRHFHKVSACIPGVHCCSHASSVACYIFVSSPSKGVCFNSRMFLRFLNTFLKRFLPFAFNPCCPCMDLNLFFYVLKVFIGVLFATRI